MLLLLAAAAPSVTAVLAGLHLQGAVWGVDCALREAMQGEAELQLLPGLDIAWLPATCADPIPAAEAVAAPLYSTPGRETHLADIMFPCRPTDRVAWVLRGLALLAEGSIDSFIN